MCRVRLTVLTMVLLTGMLSSIPFSPARAELILSSWNPNVPCTPILVTIEEILGNKTNALGGADKTGSRFDPGITTNVTGGNPKRWLTPGTTPDGWVAPGPPCLITNAQGEIVSAFVQANNVQLVSAPPREEILDCDTRYDPVNGGGPFPDWDGNGTPDLFCDTTPNLHTAGQPSVCTDTNKAGCMHRIHVEIDHNWKAARYCGAGTVCDNSTLHTLTTSSLIDVQGFVYWDDDHTDQGSHGFSGWELHPLTAWRKSPPAPGSFTWSPSTPLPGETITFTGSSFGVLSPTFNWDFGDGQQMVSSSPATTHAYPRAGAYTVALNVVDISGATFSRSDTVMVASSLSGSWNPNTPCNAIVVTIEDIRGIPTTNPGTDRRRLAQPCFVTSATEQPFATLVQINGVKRGTGVSENDYSTTFVAINGGGPYPTGSQADSAFTIYNPSFSFSCTGAGDPNCGHQLFTEIDRDWKAAGYCGPGTVCDNSTLKTQTVARSTFFDVQGFLFLNAQFANTTFHAFTGWEIRVTGWRISTLGIGTNPDSLSLMQDTSGSSSVFLTSLNGFAGTIALGASITPSGPVLALASTSMEMVAGGTNETMLTVDAGPSFPASYTIMISAVSDANSYAASISLTVTPKPNQLPELTVPVDVQSVDEGKLVSFNVRGSDADPGQNVTLSTSGLPAGASFVSSVGNPAVGTFSWTPDDAQGPGLYPIEFTATDNYWGTTSKNVTIDVHEVNERPELEAPGSQNAVVNATLTFLVNASDPDIPSNMITLNASGLVSGMSFSAAVGNPVTGIFSFTPDVSQAGMTFTITFTATDDVSPPASTSKTTTIKVSPISDPQFSGLSWTRRLSFSRTDGVQTWTARVNNRNPALGVWVNVQISGLDQTGAVSFTVSSGPVYIPAGQTLSIVLSYAFDQNTIGLTFDFNARIEWGYSPGSLMNMSPSLRDGSFRIVK